MVTSVKQMSADTARRFDHFSIHNAVQAELACSEGTCRAYQDLFTFARWRAQGFSVRKGEKGTPITTWVPMTRTDEEGNLTVTGSAPRPRWSSADTR